MTTDDDLAAACTRFRTALDEQEAMPATMKDFPLGACGNTTEMLGQYLDDRGFGVWMYIQGHRDADGWTHAWLERDGVVDVLFDDEIIAAFLDQWSQESSVPVERLAEHSKRLLATAGKRNATSATPQTLLAILRHFKNLPGFEDPA